MEIIVERLVTPDVKFYPAGHIQHDTHGRYVDASGPQSDLSDMTFGKEQAA